VTNRRSGAGAGIEVRAPKANTEFRAGDLERSGRDADDVGNFTLAFSTLDQVDDLPDVFRREFGPS